ncbi:MAG: hypothetical protein NC121_02960 [Blautia sp.]|nr:hypothetical protein [Blautia sp.]
MGANSYKISEHKDEIFTDIIKKLLWVPIAAIIPLGAKLVNIIYKNITAESQYATFSNILMVSCVVLSVLSIIISVNMLHKNAQVAKKNKLIENNKNREISSDYRFSSIIAELTFDDNRKNITSTLDYNMTVLADNVTEFKRDLIWSGSKYNGTRILQKNDNRYEIEDSQRDHSPYPYIIKFNSEKKRGETISLKTETSVVDEKLDMIPEYSFMAKYQIDELILKIIAPEGMIKNVKQAVYADRAKSICIEPPRNMTSETVRNLVVFTYRILNPTLLYTYCIEWEFTKQ